jgi:hypothetical protein
MGARWHFREVKERRGEERSEGSGGGDTTK